MSERTPVRLTVNGTDHEVRVEPRRLLGDVLREELGLTGTKLGCEHGVCGSCTVLLDGEPVRACLLFAVQCAGRDVRTVEGLAADGRLHPFQEAMSVEHGLQCGFCTAGFEMLVTGTLDRDPGLADDPERLDALLSSNLCRCTGYEGIRRAVQRAYGGRAGAAGTGEGSGEGSGSGEAPAQPSAPRA